MARYSRLSPAEQEIQDHLKQVSAGQAGINPRAQTLARSTGNPRAQRYGQQLVDQQHKQNQKNTALAENAALSQAEETAKLAKQQAKDQATLQKETAARNIRAAEAANIVTKTDVESGEKTIKTHGDGAPVFKPGPVGPVAPVATATTQVVAGKPDPDRDPATTLEPLPVGQTTDLGNPGIMLGGDGAAGTAGSNETREVFAQPIRDDRGNIRQVQPEPKTDKATGFQYVEGKDKATGLPTKTTVGVDENQRKTNQLAQQLQHLDLQDNAHKQAKAAFEPRWQPVKAEFETAKSDWEGFDKSGIQRQGNAWVRINPKTGSTTILTPEAVNAYQKQTAEAKARFDRAKKAFDTEAPRAESLTKAGRDIANAKLKLMGDKIRLDAGLPPDDGGTALALASAETGILSPEQQTAVDIAGQPTADAEPTEAGTPPSPPKTDIEAFKSAFPSVLKPEEIETIPTGTGFANVARGGETIARIDNRGESPRVVLQIGENDDIRQKIALGQTGGVPVYMRDNLKWQGEAAETEWFANVYQVMAAEPVLDAEGLPPVEDEKDFQIKQLGATREGILAKVSAGDISVQRGEALMRDLYGDTLKPDDLEDPAVFQRYLAAAPAATRYGWEQAVRTRDLEKQDAIRQDFISETFAANRGKPGNTWATMEKARKIKAERTMLDHAGEISSDLGGLLRDAGGSMAGLVMKYPVMASLVLQSVINEDAKAKRDEIFEITGRADANFARAVAGNAKKWFTPEGRKRLSALDRANQALYAVIANRDETGGDTESYKERLRAALGNVQAANYALHEMNLDEGWAVTPEDLDPNKDKALGAALLDFMETGDPAMWESFKRRQLLDKGQRQAELQLQGITEGKGKFAQAFLGGLYANDAEALIEVVTTVATAGVAKLLTGPGKMASLALKAEKAAAAATRLGRIRAGFAGAREEFRALGKVADTLAAPAGRAGKAWNKAADIAKVAGAESVTEGVEGGLAALGEPDATVGSILRDAGTEALAGLFLGPAVGAPGALAGHAGESRARNKQVAAFADWYNRTNRDTEGFAPMSPADAEAAMAMVNPETHAALVEAHAAAVAEFKDALRETAGASPDVEGDGPSGGAEVPASRMSRAIAAVTETRGAIANYMGGVIEAAQSTKEMEPPARAKTLALMKVASGRPELLTGSERGAIAGLQTREGAPYFADVQGRTVFTAEGRAELKRDAPIVGSLVQTDESQALFEASLAQPQPTAPNEPNQQGAPGPQAAQETPPAHAAARQGGAVAGGLPSTRNTGGVSDPQAAPEVAGMAAMEASHFAAARTADPSLPDAATVVRAAIAQGSPVSPSMRKAAGKAAEAADIAVRIKQRVEQAIPGIAGRIRISTGAPDIGFVTGGAYAEQDGTITLAPHDIERQLASKDPQAVEEALEQIVVRHEAVHVVQYEAVRSAWEEAGSPGTFEEFFQDWYGRIASELSPEAFAAAREIYGAEGWDAIDSDSNKAAELVRMLVEAKLDPTKVDEFSELFRAIQLQQSPTLIDTIRRAVAKLVEMITGGLLPESARIHVEQVEALYRELTGENVRPDVQSGTLGNQEVTPTESEETSPSMSNAEDASTNPDASDEFAPMRVTGLAIADAAKADPRLTPDLRRQLDFATEELQDFLEGVAPEQRRAVVDQAIAEWLEALPATEESAPGKPKKQRSALDSPHRKEAFRILNSGDFSTLSSLFENGSKIEPRPNVIALILSRKKSGKKLTNREIETLRDLSEWDGAVFQNQFDPAGNGKVAREILSLLMAKPGEGTFPNVVADEIEKGSTASDMWARIGDELNQVATGKRNAPSELDPNREWTDEEIAAAEAQQQPPALPATVEEILPEIEAEFGESSDLAAKLRNALPAIEDLDDTVAVHFPAVASAEAARLRAGVISAAEWQRLNPGALEPKAALLQRFLDSHTAETIREGMGRLQQKPVTALFSSAPQDDLFAGLGPAIGPRAKVKENAQKQFSAAPEGSKAREAIAGEIAKREGLKNPAAFVKAGRQQSFDFGTTGSLNTKNQPALDLGASISPQVRTPSESAPEMDLSRSGANKTATTPSGLTDFGEKMKGARKDRQASISREITDAELASTPLSKIWPKSEVDAIEDPALASVAHAIRSEIPRKPSSGYKLAGWVEKVKTGRILMRFAEESGVDALLQRMALRGTGLTDFADKIRVLGQVPREHWDRIGEVNSYPTAYRFGENSERIPSPFATARVDERPIRAGSLDSLIAAINGKLGTPTVAKAMQFEVRGGSKGVSINKKGDSLYRKLKTFDDAKQAFAFIKENHADLVAAWEAMKDSDNVKEDDLRTTENRPRTGKDHRQGKDATTEMFTEAFGFRGVEFGNWVTQGKDSKERQGMLNQAFDALLDLADIMGIPSRAISLNGTLGLAFGSRGKGKFAAHYEPDNLVINLTKTRGAGSLAHEYFHALDHYFQRLRPEIAGGKLMPYITYQPERYFENGRTGHIMSATRFRDLQERGGRFDNIADWKPVEGVRPEVEQAFVDLVKALDASPMNKRSQLIDKGKSNGYWSRIIERAARSFESYAIAKMQSLGYHNDYLANVTTIEQFRRDHGRYPYLIGEELAPVAEAFDNLFSTLKTKETGRGIALFSSPVQPDLFAATKAPDATQKLGAVKIGTKNALGAYRTLTAKREAGKKLTADEEQTLLDAEQALGQKMAFDMNAMALPAKTNSITIQDVRGRFKSNSMPADIQARYNAVEKKLGKTGVTWLANAIRGDARGMPNYFPIISDLEANIDLAERYRDSWSTPAAPAPVVKESLMTRTQPTRPAGDTQQSMSLGRETLKDGQITLFSSPANQAPTRVVVAVIPEGFPDERAGTKAMAEWAQKNVRGEWPSPALGGKVEVTTYGITHTAHQTRRNPAKMRVIAALPQLIEAARIVRPQTDDIVQMHAVAIMDGKLYLARISVEERKGDRRGPWNRFYDIKGVEIEDAPAVMSAFPSEDGSFLAEPGREITLAELSEIVKKVEGGDTRLFASPAPGNFRRDLTSAFSGTPASYTYESSDESRPTVLRIAEENGVRLVDSPDLDSGTRRFRERTGASPLFFRGGDIRVAGFVSRQDPSLIFVNADSDRVPASWTLAHELTHVAQKDKASGAGAINQTIAEHLSAGEFTALENTLRRSGYKETDLPTEIPAFLVADAVTGGDVIGFREFARGAELKAALLEWFDSMPSLKPQSLESASDDELAAPLFASPAPETTAAVEAALASMPPVYRQVFQAVSGGMSEAEVSKKFGISPTGVANILNAVRSRLESATSAAGANGLQAEMRDGKFVGGRPDLALSTNPQVAAIDQIRNDSDVPGVREWEEVLAAADKMIQADYSGTYAMVLAKARDLQAMTDVETAAAKMIIARETMEGRITSAADRTKLALLIHGYRDIGTETARALAIRRDPHKKPAERHAQFIAEALFTPDEATRKRLKKAKKGEQEEMLKGWLSRVDAIKAELLAQGIDIEATLAEFNAREQAQKQALDESPQTKAVIDETYRKLTKREKAVIQQMRSGAKLSQVSFNTGLDPKDVLEIFRQFRTDIRDALRKSAQKFLDGTLAASAPDMLDDILSEFGVQSEEDFNDMVPGYKERQAQKEKEKRDTKKPKPEPKKPEKPSFVATPEQEARWKALADKWRNAPFSTWRTLWQDEMTKLGPIFGVSFEKALDEFIAPWKALWQTEMDLRPKEGRMTFDQWMEKPAEREKFRKQLDIFAEPINETTGPSEKKTVVGQGSLGLDPVNETTGEFDLNDPVAMKRVMDAFAIGRGNKMDALIEYWRMSILTGPQTHIVNVGSNILNTAWDLLPRRATEATINTVLGLVGQGSDRSATFGEFVPMARQLRRGIHLAARNALRSWQVEGRTFEAYARAEALQLDFSGLGSEYVPPALGGKIGKLMRSLSFRAMTAADEMLKSFYGQVEVAAQAHRIAAREEKLKGTAYESRLAELMEPGSVAWLRAIDGAKRITFQEELDGDNPRMIRRLDQIAGLVKQGRGMPWLGRPLTLLIPFVDTPLNIFKQAVEMSPLGAFLAVTDGIRALRRRVFNGKLTPAEAKAEAEEIYDRLRFIKDLTNQTIAWGAFFALQGLVDGDDDELPVITGTVPYKTTSRGERDNAYAVMPPMTIRLGGTQFSYARIEPFATMLASTTDLLVGMRRQGGLNSAVATETLARFKDQVSEKTFLQGLSSLLNAIEDPDRFAERLAANIATGFVPNIIRQPLREADVNVRDQNPRAGDGFFTSIGKRVGYSLVPQKAPVKIDVWGKPVGSNRGALIGGSRATDVVFRILDPTNAQVSPDIDPIDRWIFRWNLETADSKDHVAIEPIKASLPIRFPGEKSNTIVPLSSEEHLEANQRAGEIARSLLGGDWENEPLSLETADRIKDAVMQAQKAERAALKIRKLAEGKPE